MKSKLKTNKDILMFYQTSIRNVALTTAVAFASLSYSRFYRNKNSFYSFMLTLVSFLILAGSFILNKNLYIIIRNHNKINKLLTGANNFLIINILFLICHLIIIFYASNVLYEYYKK